MFRGSAAGFSYSAALNTGASPRGLTAADLNQDGWHGHPDVLSTSGRLYRGNGDRTLKPADDFAFYAEQLEFVDWNRDGLVDIVSGGYQTAA